jgi:tRNA(Ile)-lysidine synthase
MAERLPMDVSLLKPGLRLAVGLSGGADSVALTRALAERSGELGIVLSAAHLHHGLRGAEADRDCEFSQGLSGRLGIAFHTARVDVAVEAQLAGETIEEAARRLRYGWFRELMAAGVVDAVATAHTLDDQAETVCAKFLRGAWTEGFSGIHPLVAFAEGRILRPLLGASRVQVESYLGSLGQGWCEDDSNRDLAFTRNRIRRELLPELERWNPRLKQHLAQMAELARDEEDWWDAEMARLAPQLVLTGRPVRGGGRAGYDAEGVAIDVVRLGAQPVAVQRRLLRYAVGGMGVSLGFEATETLRGLAVEGRAGQKFALPGPLTAERTPRELRISVGAAKAAGSEAGIEVSLPVPGEVEGFGWRFRAEGVGAPALVRNWRAGDRVTLRYSSGPRKIKEVLERLKVTGTARAEWPVVAWRGRIVWMQGVELAPVDGISLLVKKIPE